MTPLTHPDLDLARRLASEAASILTHHFNGLLTISHKGAVDLVTQADLASEARMAAILLAERPEDGLLGEEGSTRESQGNGRRWIIDPLDGTMNFVHGLPHFCISIALEVAGVLELGLILQPITNECFEAVRGQGAYLGGRRLGVSQEVDFGKALVATGFPTDRRTHLTRYMPLVASVLIRGQGLRRAGAAALDLAYVAAGRLDAFWEFSLKPWDVAAGALLVSEAGGRCSNLSGEAHRLSDGVIVASNGHCHGDFLKVLGDAASQG